MNTGISLYCSTGVARNEELLAQAAAAGVHCAFTSLQIPEETGGERKAAALGLLGACKQHGIPLIVDVGADTAAGLGCNSLYELQRWGITALRLDDGFCAPQAAELSREFQIVFNASTVTPQEIEGWQRAGADLTLDSIADEGTTVVITIPFERTVDPVQNGGRSGPEASDQPDNTAQPADSDLIGRNVQDDSDPAMKQ